MAKLIWPFKRKVAEPVPFIDTASCIADIYQRANETMAEMQRPLLEMRATRLEAERLGWRMPR